MNFRAKTAVIEAAMFELAGGRYAAVAVAGAVHTVPAEVFEVLYEPEPQPLSKEDLTAAEMMADQQEKYLHAAAIAESVEEKVGGSKHPNTHAWNQMPQERALREAEKFVRTAVDEADAKPKPNRNPDQQPVALPPMIKKANPLKPAPDRRRESPAQEQAMELLRKFGSMTTKELGARMYPDHDPQSATQNTYPLVKVMQEKGLISKMRFAEKDELGTERAVEKWVVAA